MGTRSQDDAVLVVGKHIIEHQRRRRTYTVVHGAHGVEPGGSLVIVLHGTLQSGNSVRRRYSGRSFDALTRTGDVVVAYPDAIRREWNGAHRAVMLSPSAKDVDDVGFICAFVGEIAARWSIDRERVFIVGFSLGGQMAIRLIHDAPELLAGAVIVGATLPARDNLVTAGKPPRAMPVVLVHGTADPMSQYNGGVVSLRGRLPEGKHLSALETASYFAVRNGIDNPLTIGWVWSDKTPAEIGSVSQTDYRQPGRPPVRLYSVIGGGHQIPGTPAIWPWLFGESPSTLSTAAVMDEFFGQLQADQKR